MSGVTSTQRSARSSCRRQADVAVVEHRGGVEHHFEDHHGDHRRPEHADGGELDQHRQNDFQRMKARAGGQVVIQIGVMHSMQPPQQRHGMHHDVLQPDDEVHRDHRQRHGKHEGHLEMVQQAPTAFR
jgi:hypothetical protein